MALNNDTPLTHTMGQASRAKLRQISIPRNKASILSLQQHQDFFAYLATTRQAAQNRAIYLLGYRTGMRIASIAGLGRNEVLNRNGNLEEVVELRRDIVKDKGNYAAYLSHAELRETLAEYLAERPETDVPDLFITQQSTAFSANSRTHKMLRFYRKADYEGASSHSPRRSFATNYSRAGPDIVSFKTFKNHPSIQQTSGYVAPNDEILEEAVCLV